MEENLIDTQEQQGITCLNCGATCHDKFCPHCGQRTDTTRLRNLNSIYQSAGDVFRFNGPLTHTIKDVLLHPDTIVADYIRGHRVSYTAPFVFIITTIIYLSFIYLLCDAAFGTSLVANNHTNFVSGAKGFESHDTLAAFLDWLANNDIVTVLALAVPTFFATRLVYRKHGASRFNVAEYVVAAVYLYAGSLIIDAVSSPLLALISSDGDDWSFIFFYTYTIYASYRITRRAFPIKKRSKRIKKFIKWYITVNVFSGICFFAIFAISCLAYILFLK